MLRPAVLAALISAVLSPALVPAEPPLSAEDCDELGSRIDRAVELRHREAWREAEAVYREILAAAVAGRCRFREAETWNGLGVLAILRSRLVSGVDHLDRALSVLRKVDPARADSDEVARLRLEIELNRSTACFRLGLLDEARDSLRVTRALGLRHGAPPQVAATILLTSAQVHRLRGELAEAREMALEGLEVLGAPTPVTEPSAKTRAALWQERARLDLEQGLFDDADRALDRALGALGETAHDLARANLLGDRAELRLRRGRWRESLRWSEEALRLGSSAASPDLNLEAHLRYLRSVALWELGDPGAARRASESGLALLEALRTGWQDLALQFFALRQKYFRHRLDLAMATESPEDAWRVFESYRARGLVESAVWRAGRSAEPPSPAAAAEVERRRRELREAVVSLDRWDPASGKDALLRRETLLRVRRLALRRVGAEARHGLPPPPAQEPGPSAAIELLDAESLGLIFASGTTRVHVLLLSRRGGLEALTLSTDRQLIEALVASLGRLLDPHAPRRFRSHREPHVARLSEALLGPLAGRIRGFRRLVIVTEGPLERLPFEVLRDPESGRRLIESHEIVYLPSFSVLETLRRRTAACSPAVSQLLAIGDPVFGSEDPRWPAAADARSADEALSLPRLPGTAGEVRAVADLFSDPETGPPGVAVLLGPEATRQRFLAAAPQHRVLHVASHGRSDPRVPERSKIALSCVDSADRVLETCDLYFEDVLSLELCGQVVVLSACESAVGRPVDGEGTLGLPRAFLQAGASAVLASLWQVADDTTALLMASFYRRLRAGADASGALREAKRVLIEAGHPPATWGAFVLLGDWRAISSPSSTFSPQPGPIGSTRPAAGRPATDNPE